jgi:hypothetical protein
MLGNAVDDLLSGKMILGIEDIIYRNSQKLVIEKMKKSPYTILLGSSRSFLVRESCLGLEKTGNYFNHSVGNATLKDYIAILGAYKLKGELPAKIIIQVDPQLFDKRWDEYLSSWQLLSFANEYYYFMECLNYHMPALLASYKIAQYKISKTKALISQEYTVKNFKSFLSGTDVDYRIANCMYPDVLIKMPDGSLCYPFSKRSQYASFTQEENKRFLKNAKGHIHQQSLQSMFIDLIDYLVNNGTQIVFFLPPYNPSSYREIDNDIELRYVHNYERMLRDLAQLKKIPVIGSYNPNIFHLSNKDFLDAVHMNNDRAMERVFKGYKKIINKNEFLDNDSNKEIDNVVPTRSECHLLEAEYANSIVYPLEVDNDENASEGKFIYSPNGRGNRYISSSVMATYTVTISKAGEYILWGRVIAGGGDDNSFFIEIDKGFDNLWQVQVGKNWHWDAVNYHERADPVKFILFEGQHTIKVKLREDGTKLDKLLLTSNLDFVPDDKISIAENPDCSGS